MVAASSPRIHGEELVVGLLPLRDIEQALLLDGLVHLQLLVLFRFGLGCFPVGRSREDVFSQEFYLLGLPPSKHNTFPIHVLRVIA